MKNVRYLAGAVGMAPALGLMLPAGNATANVTHVPANSGKAVSLAPVRGAHPRNFGDCAPPRVFEQGFSGKFVVSISGTSKISCISFVSGRLPGGHTELDMRTRYYSNGGAKIGPDHFDAGHRVSGSTVWRHTAAVDAIKVCAALVEASNHNDKKFGAICVSTKAF